MARLFSWSMGRMGVPSAAVLVIVIAALLVGYFLTMISAVKGFALVLLLLIFICTFLWPEAGLYLVIFAMLLSPEIIAGQIGERATGGRGLTLRLEDFLLFFIALSWFARSALDKTTGLFRTTPLNKPIAAYILACLLATLWGRITGNVQGKAGIFFVLKYFEYMIVFFMVINYVGTEDQAKRLLLCLFLTCFIVSIYGLIQIPGGGRVSAPFEGERGEPNTFGGYLLLMGAVAAALLDKLKDFRVRLALAVLLLVLVISLLYTQSRATYLAVIPTYIFIAMFSRRRFYLLAGLILAVMLGPVVLPRVAKERLAYTFAQPEHRGQLKVGKVRLDTSTSARLISWKECVRGWLKRPILGYGVTGYTFIDAQYFRLLVETGIVGLTAFGWLMYALFRVGWDRLKVQSDDLLSGLSIGLTAGLVGLLVHAIGANTFIIVRIMEPFWCLVGIVIALSELKYQNVSAPAT
jgi:O-antigen ligase